MTSNDDPLNSLIDVVWKLNFPLDKSRFDSESKQCQQKLTELKTHLISNQCHIDQIKYNIKCCQTNIKNMEQIKGPPIAPKKEHRVTQIIQQIEKIQHKISNITRHLNRNQNKDLQSSLKLNQTLLTSLNTSYDTNLKRICGYNRTEYKQSIDPKHGLDSIKLELTNLEHKLLNLETYQLQHNSDIILHKQKLSDIYHQKEIFSQKVIKQAKYLHANWNNIMHSVEYND